MFSTAGLILAPAMLWGWVFYHSHRYKQTRLLLLLLLFAGGFLSGLLALVLNHSIEKYTACLLYTSPSPRDATLSRMPSSA